MKFVIASDIHGNAKYAGKLIKRFESEQANALILLGDIYNPGPRNPVTRDYAPLTVADMLNAVKDKLTVVKGNCDSQVDTLISQFDFVEECNIYECGKKITLTHGHIYNAENLPKNCGDALIYGHFHVGSIKRVGDIIIANAGSVSLPKDGSAHSYLTLSEDVLTLKDVVTGDVIAETVI